MRVGFETMAGFETMKPDLLGYEQRESAIGHDLIHVEI